jgi:hypothetical protein
MADMNSFLQIFAVVSLVGILVSFLIRVSIQALILRYFTKKYELPQKYGMAWLAILIPSLIVSLIALPLVFIGFLDFLAIIIWLLFFPLLIFSVKLVYKTETGISTAISSKFFLVILILVVVIAGVQTILGIITNPLKSNVPQPICTTDCEFAYSLGDNFGKVGSGSLTVKGYNIPAGKYQEKDNYVIAEKIFSVSKLNSLKTGKRDVNNNERIQGKLNANSCTYMDFSRESSRTSGRACKRSSKNFFTNLKKILVG